MADKSFTTTDVSSHKDDASGYWLIIEDGVYDVSSAFFPPFPSYLSRAWKRTSAAEERKKNGPANESATAQTL